MNELALTSPEEREAQFEEALENELDLLPDELSERWRTYFEEFPNVYKTAERRFKKIAEIRDRREGRRIEFEDISLNDRIAFTEKQRTEMIKAAKEAVASIEQEVLFLGNGATADVFLLETSMDICVKYIARTDPYQQDILSGEGNSLATEISYLERVEQLVVEGVRAPRYLFMVPGKLAYCMEAMDALNLSLVLGGKIPFHASEKLDPQEFARRLQNYLKALHGMGIVHGDIAARNIMIDKKTLLPVVIDFGKAKDANTFDATTLEDRIKMELETAKMLGQYLERYQKGERFDFSK